MNETKYNKVVRKQIKCERYIDRQIYIYIDRQIDREREGEKA